MGLIAVSHFGKQLNIFRPDSHAYPHAHADPAHACRKKDSVQLTNHFSEDFNSFNISFDFFSNSCRFPLRLKFVL